MKKMITWIKEGKRMYWSITIKFLFGIVLLINASQCRIPAVIMIFGLLYAIGSFVGILMGIDKMKAYVKWWEERPPIVYRLWSVGTIGLGLLLFFSV